MPDMTTIRAETLPERLFPGDSEMARRVRGFDWSGTPLGPIENWPHSLATAVRIVLDSRHPMCVWCGPQLINIYNDAYAPMLAARHPNALGLPGPEIWPEAWDDVRDMIEPALAGTPCHVENRLCMMQRHGYIEEAYFTFSYSPIPDDRGGIGGVICPVIENTQQMLDQRRMKTLRQLAARIGDDARSAEQACRIAAEVLAGNRHDLPFALIYLLDADGKNARLAGAMGLPAGAPAAPASIDLAAAEERAAAWPLRRVLETGRAEDVMQLERRFGTLPAGVWPEPPRSAVALPLGKSGQGCLAGFLVAGVSPRRALDDDYRHFLGQLADCTAASVAHAGAYEEERRRADALAELDRAKTAFFSNISHEFRTPLTLLLGPVEDLLARPHDAPPDDLREQLGIIRRNALRLQKLVSTLLDFSRIEEGRMQASYQPTDLSVLTADLASVFRSLVESGGLRLVVDCPPLPEPVFVDRDMWEKIVLNLVSNAFKYTLHGEIRVELRADAGAAALSVRDTGIGIPEAELPQLFNRFHRVREARGRTEEGTGIGLAFAQELAKLHGGAITVDSRIGKGSAFTVRIPFGRAHLALANVSTMPAAASSASGAQSFLQEARQWLRDAGGGEFDANASHPAGGKPKATVLVAEDNADMREYLKRLLADEYEIIDAGDGQQALRAALRHQPDLVLADVTMPSLNGFELLRALRAETATAAGSVILLSARADEAARTEGMRAGADDYITKPFSARELLARVNATVALAKLRRKTLRREEELWAETVNVLENIGEGFMLVDSEWRIKYVNAAAERFSRMPRDRMLDMNYWEVFPATLGTVVERNYRRSMTDHISVRFEHYYAPYDRWFELAASPIGGGGLMQYAHDITDRKQAEETLRATEARLTVELEAMNRLHELSTRLLASPDLDNALEEVLDAAIAMLGAAMGSIQLYNPQTKALEIVTQRGFRKDFLDYFRAPRSSEGSACGRAARLRERVIIEDVQADPAYAPLRQIAASAGYRAVQSTPLISRGGQLLGILSTHFRQPHRPSERDLRMLDLYARQAIDLVERIRAEDALRESETRFRALAEASPALIWQVDPLGNAVYLNPRYRELLGQAATDLMGFGCRSLVYPDDRAAYMAAIEQAQRQRARLKHRVRVRNKCGNWRWLESYALPWFTAEGEYAGHVGISIDVTEAVRAEDARKRADRRKDEFLATLAHELRNPLAPICNALRLLRYPGGIRAADRLHEMMERQVGHIVRLVDDLLEVSRITQGKVELRKEPVELTAIVRSAVEANKPLIESAGHELAVDLPAEPLMLDADAVRLTQVFANLLNNAAKYTAAGGRIRLAARCIGDHVSVTVRDSGIGIASDMLPRVFNMFAQADHSAVRGQGGLGIGLTLVRNLVEMHGGSIEARSEGPGMGSEFMVRLPLTERVRPAAAPKAEARTDAPLSGQRILVVDDNRDSADSLALLLQFLGAEVDVAHDGAAALAALENRRPAVVLMDIGMPGMDGYQAARQIRRQPRFDDVMLIALTGWGQEEDRRRARDSGFDHHLIKPVDIDALQALLATA
jgi:PAS domain S-box-containing protein